jgi:hypothetical protein
MLRTWLVKISPETSEASTALLATDVRIKIGPDKVTRPSMPYCEPQWNFAGRRLKVQIVLAITAD